MSFFYLECEWRWFEGEHCLAKWVSGGLSGWSFSVASGILSLNEHVSNRVWVRPGCPWALPSQVEWTGQVSTFRQLKSQPNKPYRLTPNYISRHPPPKLRLVLVELVACRLVPKMLECHEPFWSPVFKTDLGLSPSRPLALRPTTRLSILETNGSAKLTELKVINR